MSIKSTATSRRGFSFTEILFAVMILGVGFIMIAAIYPASMQQTAATVQDTQGSTVGKAAVQYIQSIASNQTLPVTGTSVGTPGAVRSLQEVAEAWKQSRGNYVLSQNRRYGWVGMYRRDMTLSGPAESAQVIVIVAQARNRAEFQMTRTTSPGGVVWNDVDQWNWSKGWNTTDASRMLANLEPRKVRVQVTWNASRQIGQLQFLDSWAHPIAATGAYVVVSRDQTTPPNGVPGGRLTGRIFQLGNPQDNTGQWWDLAPGSDLLVGEPDLNIPTEAYILGRGFQDPANGVRTFAGPAMDVAVYTSFVRINN